MDETKNKSAVRIIEMQSLETEYPIIEESRNWITYGETNSYPDYLLDLFLESPTNNAIITATTNMIAGDGLEVEGPESNPVANKLLQTMFSPSNLKKIAFNLKLYGYAPILVKGGAHVTSIEVSDANKWRSGKKDEDGNVTHWLYSDDWSRASRAKYRPKPYTLFSYRNVEATQVFIFKLPMIGLDYYPPVDYNGGTCYIQLEAEIGEFHLSAIQNGLNPSTIINFNGGIPPDSEQAEIEGKVKNKFSGASNAGRFFLSFNDDKDSATTVDTLEMTDIDKQYEFLSKEATSKIMVAHRVVSPIMFGIRDNSGMGNNAEELKESYLLYHETVVRAYQEIILDGVQDVLYKNKISFNAKWIDFMPFQREVATEERAPTATESRLAIDEFNKSLVKPPKGYKSVKEEPYLGQEPKNNGMMTTMYKLVRANPVKRDIVLSQVSGDDKYYSLEFVRAHPNTRDMYWVESTFVISK